MAVDAMPKEVVATFRFAWGFRFSAFKFDEMLDVKVEAKRRRIYSFLVSEFVASSR